MNDCPCGSSGLWLTDTVKAKRLMAHLPVDEDAQKGYRPMRLLVEVAQAAVILPYLPEVLHLIY